MNGMLATVWDCARVECVGVCLGVCVKYKDQSVDQCKILTTMAQTQIGL